MNTKLFVYTCILLMIAVLQGCSDSDNSSSGGISLTAKEINNGFLISGGEYRILNTNNQVMGSYSLTSGTMHITDLPTGIYVVEETKSPDGYIVSQQKIEVIVRNSRADVSFLYINSQTRVIPGSQELQFFDSRNYTFLGNYKATRIGEYYWIDRNFNHKITAGNSFENDVPIAQDLLNKYLERVRIDPKYFQIPVIDDFEKYYGRYYSYPSINYMNESCFMADEDGNKIEGWRLPVPADYRQLFAMCPFNTSYDSPHTTLNERDVRFTLGTKPGENSLAFNIDQGNNSPYKVYWFSPSLNTNKYGFNMMPGGARLNGDGPWCNGLGPDGGCYNDGKWGDIYHLFYTADFAVQNSDRTFGAVIVHDYVDTKEYETYHYLNVRWCRPLTNAELGYKLYINTDKTDIKKLDLNTAAPNGYTELPHGYIRGFYVQYMLDNPNASVTVSDIVNYAKNVEDNYVYENKGNPNVVL